jgi:hypothetical protein
LIKIVNRFAHAMLEDVHLVLNLLEMSKRSQRRLMDRGPGFKVNMLGEQTETQASGTYDFTAIRRLVVINQVKDRCLTRAVAPHEPDMLTRIHL